MEKIRIVEHKNDGDIEEEVMVKHHLEEKAEDKPEKEQEKPPGKFAVKRRKLMNNSLFMVVFLSFTVNLLVEVLSRHSLVSALKYMVQSPLVFLVNMMILMATYSFALVLKRRVFWYSFISFIWVLLGFVNCITLLNRMTPFNMSDLSVLDEGFDIIKGYLPGPLLTLSITGIVVFLVGCIVLFIFGPKKKTKINYKRNGAVLLSMLLVICLGIQGSIKIGIVDTYFPNLAYGFRDNGFPYSFISSWVSKGISKPDDYSAESIKEMFGKDELGKDGIYRPKKAEGAAGDEKPNIIFVQLESFIDPTTIKDLEYSKDPIPTFRKLKKTCSTGLFEVPAIGAGTANTEFEVISGISARFFGPGEYPYKEVLKEQTLESAAYDLKGIGYSAHAIHNHRAVFYSRNDAFANMGFDTFTSLEYMNNTVRTPKGWAKDSILPQQISDAVLSTKGRDYIYTISVQGHGAYPEEQILMSPEITVNKAPSSEQKWKYEYYINQLYEMDKFVHALTNKFENFKEDTVIVFYGDHIPALDITQKQIRGKRSLYQTEYIIWSNFGLEKKDKDCKAYQMTAELFDRLDIHEGLITKYTQEHKNDKDYEENLRALSYDIIYGKRYIYGEKNPFKRSDLHMGVKEIKVKDVVRIGNKYYIKGENFTEYSTVSLDGEIIETTYLGPTILATKEEISRSDVKRLKVSQVEKYDEILSTTE